MQGVDNVTATYAEEDEDDSVSMPDLDDVDDSDDDDVVTDASTTQSADSKARIKFRDMLMSMKSASYDVPVDAVHAALAALEPTHRALLDLIATDLDVLRPRRAQQGR